jgi:hypothetical protein
MSFKTLVTKASALAMAAGLAAAVASAPAEAARTKIGVLTCNVGPGIGMIVGSTKHVSCDFAPADARREHYSGTISKVGLDVGFTAGGVLVWGVFAPDTSYSRHALSGHYSGASAEASLVAGVGANALVGGSAHHFTLQPFSVQGNAGVNFAAGVATLDLHS